MTPPLSVATQLPELLAGVRVPHAEGRVAAPAHQAPGGAAAQAAHIVAVALEHSAVVFRLREVPQADGLVITCARELSVTELRQAPHVVRVSAEHL